ncbi:MAG: hypothetical protein ACO307_19775, partial [Ilumatobacteraceae bacterium]
GWIVGLLFGLIDRDPSTKAYRIVTDPEGRQTDRLQFPWPFLDERNSTPDRAIHALTGVLESFVIAELLQDHRPDLRESYIALIRLGQQALPIMQEFINTGRSPQASQRIPETRGAEPSDRHRTLVESLEAGADAYQGMVDGGSSSKPYWIDDDWLLWYSRLLKELSGCLLPS